jgi:hypothetical protein
MAKGKSSLVCFQLEEEFEDTKGGNQNAYIKEEQTTQWPKEKVQKDKLRSNFWFNSISLETAILCLTNSDSFESYLLYK